MVVTAIVVSSGSLTAQRVDSRFPAHLPSQHRVSSHVAPDTTVSDGGRRVTGGILGAAAGTVFGAVVGAYVERGVSGTCYDWCGFTGGLLGAVIGEGLGFGVGSHGPGSGRTLAAHIFYSSLIASAGAITAIMANDARPLLLVFPLQLALLL